MPGAASALAMSSFPSEYYRPRRPSPLPLILAGAALVLTLYLVWERWGRALIGSGVDAEPRVVTPRGDLMEVEKTTIRIFEENAPSVVHITTPDIRVQEFIYTYQLPGGTGSGFVWDDRGYVVTNYHVVAGREKRKDILVRLWNHREYAAQIVGTSPRDDIAVLKMAFPPPGLRPLLVGTAGDLKVGQAVFAIGNPFGLEQTLTTGIISALNRSILSLERTPITGVIQVDAAINPGNSGGPLLDSAGRLIGMNTAILDPAAARINSIASSIGIGFAVPVDTINRVVPSLIKHGNPGAFLGVQLNQLPNVGPLVISVVPGSGAEAAGVRGTSRTEQAIQYGDVIVAIDGKPVRTPHDLNRLLRDYAIGAWVELAVLRGLPEDPERVTLRVQLQ